MIVCTKLWKTINHVWLELTSKHLFWWLFWTQQTIRQKGFWKHFIFERSSFFGLQFWLHLFSLVIFRLSLFLKLKSDYVLATKYSYFLKWVDFCHFFCHVFTFLQHYGFEFVGNFGSSAKQHYSPWSKEFCKNLGILVCMYVFGTNLGMF